MSDLTTLYDSSFADETQASRLSSVSVGSDASMFSVSAYIQGSVLSCTILTYNRILLNVPYPLTPYSPTTRSSPPSHSPSTTRPRTPPPTSSQKSPNAASSRSSPQTFYSTPPSPSSKHPTRPQGISRWPITRSQCPGGTCRRLLMLEWRKKSMEAPQGSSLLAALRFKGSCLSKVKASWIKFAPLSPFICSCGSRFCSLWWCLLCSGCSQVSSTMPSAIRAKLRFSDINWQFYLSILK